MNAALWGSVLGGLGVALGAFGAHGLKQRVAADMLAVWETGVRYQLVHALALLAVAALARGGFSGAARATPWMLAGTLLFSGSLYALTLGAPSKLGLLTPIGGVALIVGWVMLALSVRGS
ncbi:MAG: DUF423 domain-containing protein [Planctomycetota bacterium]|nr:MAG: DUF423 domain-containing protein [Planctomycetota bacterium]